MQCDDDVVCYSEWAFNISPSIVCNQGSIQRFDIIKNPKDIGFNNEETMWSCNSVGECNQKIPNCENIDFSPSPTSTPDVGGGGGDDSPTETPLASSSNFATMVTSSPEQQLLVLWISILAIAWMR